MNRPSFRQYLIRGSIWVALGKMVGALAGFFISAILARVLVPEDMATFFLANSIAIFLALNYRFGLDNLMLRLISENLSINNQLYAKELVIFGIVVVGAISFFSSLILYFGLGSFLISILFPNQSLEPVLGFVIIWAVILAFQFLLGEVFRAFKEMHLTVLVGGAFTALLSLSLLFALWIFSNQYKLEVVLSVVILAGVINFIIGLVLLNIRMKRIVTDTAATEKSQKILSGSWPFWVNAVTHYTLGFSGLWILGKYAGGLDVAYYGAAIRLTILVATSLVVVNSVIAPLIAGMSVNDENDRLERMLRGAGTLASIPSIMIIFIFSIFAEEIMVLVFGVAYESGADILRILLFGHLAGALTGSHGYLLMMTGHQKTIMYISVVSAMLAVIVGIQVGEAYGVIGVAWVTSVMITAQQITAVILARQKTGIWCHFSIKKFCEFIKKDMRKGVS